MSGVLVGRAANHGWNGKRSLGARFDSSNPGELRVDLGDRSWQRIAISGILIALIAMPGLGLLLTAWLFHRLRKPRCALP